MKSSIGTARILAVLAAFAGGVAVTSGPACAFDDRPSTFSPLLGFLGVGGDAEKDKDDIDFRERPPLVVPRGSDLPAPRPGSSNRTAAWPKDQDVVRRRDEAAQARVPRQIELNKNPVLERRELARGRTDEEGVAVSVCDTYVNGIPDCAPTPMEKIKQVFAGKPDRDVVVVGKEPDRQYLTEPPRGYRRATQTTKATVEGGYERPDPSNAQQYYRDQAKRNSEYR